MPRPKSEGQIPVKIPVGMDKAIIAFLKTETAQKLGLDSKSDVLTEALCDFFKKHDWISTKSH